MSKNHGYGYGVESANTFGLNPEEFFVHIGVNRRDGRAFTAEQLAAVEAALAPLAAKNPAPVGDPAKVKAAAAENEARHKAMVAKVTGKKPVAKAPSKPAKRPASKPRKTGKASPRKAARRPS